MSFSVEASRIVIGCSTDRSNCVAFKVKICSNISIDIGQAAIHQFGKSHKLVRIGYREVHIVDVSASLANHFQMALQNRMVILSQRLIEVCLAVSRSTVVNGITEFAVGHIRRIELGDSALHDFVIAEATGNQCTTETGKAVVVCYAANRGYAVTSFNLGALSYPSANGGTFFLTTN